MTINPKRIFSRGVSIYSPKLFLKFPSLLRLPDSIMIESTNFCNLNCKLCTHKDMKRKQGRLTLSKYKKIVKNLGYKPKTIVLQQIGEPFMNKELLKLAEYTCKQGIKPSVFTNGTLLHHFDADKILKSGINKMVIALDGLDQETVGFYRVGAKFDDIFNNIKNLVKRREEIGGIPDLRMQFLMMKHNEHQLEGIRKLAKKYKITLVIKSVGSFGHDVDMDKWLPKDRSYSRYQQDIQQTITCPNVFESGVILYNGDVVLCCADYDGTYFVGNVFEKTFKEIFRSEEYTNLRKRYFDENIELCKSCDLNIKGSDYSKIEDYTNE